MTEPTRKRIWFCRIVASSVIGFVATVFYMAIDRDPPYEYLAGNILPDTPHVGEQIAIHWHIKAHRFCPGRVARNITDQSGYIWRNKGGPVRENREQLAHIVNTIDLPKNLGAGPATYFADVCYRCNPLHRIWPLCVRTPELKFEIRP
jgi:hypothetical protein